MTKRELKKKVKELEEQLEYVTDCLEKECIPSSKYFLLNGKVYAMHEYVLTHTYDGVDTLVVDFVKANNMKAEDFDHE